MKQIIQLTSGKGPAECCWVVAKILKILLEEARMKFGLKAEVIYRVEGPENGTLASAVVEISGANTNQFIKLWVGTVKWIGESEFRKNHKRKNWFIGVNHLDELSVSTLLNESEVRFETFRSGGAGGQHVNKVETAVRVIHLPTGISSTCSSERSQLQNKKKALIKLKKALEINAAIALKEQAQNAWSKHGTLERGDPIRTFKGGDFKSKETKPKFKKERNKLKRALNDELKKWK